MGKSPNSIIQINEDLKKDAGDQVTTGLLMKLSGDGVTGDSTLEGNEEALIFRDFAITIDQIRNAVRTKGKMEEQKTPIDLKQKAKDALSVWLQEYTEKKIFSKLTNSPTSDRVVYAGTAKTEATLAATDKFTADLIGKARRIAIADKYAKIRPVSVDGKNLYVMIVDPWQARDLRSDAKWLAAQQSANIRGETNPIFTGALGMYEGVVVHENELIPRTATGARHHAHLHRVQTRTTNRSSVYHRSARRCPASTPRRTSRVPQPGSSVARRGYASRTPRQQRGTRCPAEATPQALPTPCRCVPACTPAGSGCTG